LILGFINNFFSNSITQGLWPLIFVELIHSAAKEPEKEVNLLCLPIGIKNK